MSDEQNKPSENLVEKQVIVNGQGISETAFQEMQQNPGKRFHEEQDGSFTELKKMRG